MTEKFKTIAIKCDENFWKELKLISIINGISMTDLAKEALRGYIEQKKPQHTGATEAKGVHENSV